MSKRKTKTLLKNAVLTFMVVVIVIAGVWMVLYKAGNPYVRQWAYRLGLVSPPIVVLHGADWVWAGTSFSNGSSINAPGGDAFVLAFNRDGRFTSTTDCNSLFGNFYGRGSRLGFSSIIQTKIYCGPASLESEYSSELARANSFSIRGQNLVIELEDGSGNMTFRRK